MHSSLVLAAAGLCARACIAATVTVDFGVDEGRMKPLHGVNNSPVRVRKGATQHEFAAAGIPFMRTHDTAGGYGGAHYVDIPNIFRDFGADENDPASYDFALTDAYLKPVVEAGTEIFFRLGTTIENNWRIASYNIDPPADFAKWARVCEHVVRHYNEGWANGFRWNIRYWEVWNEPENPPMWKGTREQFFEMYRVAANHLKECFPHIKVGGYAGCGFYAVDDRSYRMRHNAFYQGFVTWFEDFCRFVTDEKTRAPLDFFSWHLYLYEDTVPERIRVHADYVRRTLDAAGLTETESIFDEWNWNPLEDWVRIKGHEGAAVVAGSFAVMQKAPVDAAMYYDALPTRGHGGLFFFPNVEPTPAFYSFMAYDALYRMGTAVRCEEDAEGLYAVAAKGGGEYAILISNASAEPVGLAMDVRGYAGAFRRYRIAGGDRELCEDGYWRQKDGLTVPANSVLLLSTREVDVAAARYARPKKSSVNGLDDGASLGNPYDYKRLEVRDVAPVSVFTNAAGLAVADFGVASFGWLEMVGEGGYSIIVGEITNGEGRVVNPYHPLASIRAQRLSGEAPGCRYRVPMPEDPVNVRGYNAACPAITLPKEIGTVYPFRFAEIVWAPCAAADLVQKAVNYPIDMAKSSLSSSSRDLVRLYEFCKHTVRATSFCGIYVDGDRERTPYEADAYINQLCHYAIDDDYSLARKSHEWLLEHPTWPTEWKQHSIMMAWADWMWTGDTQSLAKYYDRLRDEKLPAGCRVREDGLLVSPGSNGGRSRDIVDWPMPERDGFVFTPVNAVVNAFHYRNLLEMAAIARALDEPEDARRFAEGGERVRLAFDKAFYRPETGLYADGESTDHVTLHANAAALAFGLVPESRRRRVADYLESRGLACSVYFAQYYLEALCAADRYEAVVKLMLSHGDRSWLGMIDFGATMTMEAWNVNSKPNLDLNHPWGAVPLNIISRYILGVTPLEPGFAKVSVRPHAGGLERVRGTVPTARGPVTVEIDGDRLTVTTAAPALVTWNGQTCEMQPGTRSF